MNHAVMCITNMLKFVKPINRLDMQRHRYENQKSEEFEPFAARAVRLSFRSRLNNASLSRRRRAILLLFARLTVRTYVWTVRDWTLQQSMAKSTERQVQQIAYQGKL